MNRKVLVTSRLTAAAGAALVVATCADTATAPELLDSRPVHATADATRGVKCYVIGDTSGNDPSRVLGSKKNPYGSLAAVEADLTCQNIEVLYSATVLDGGIWLKSGQKIRGEPGPAGQLPTITNSSGAANDGRGIVLADKTTVQELHVLDTWGSGIYGLDVDGVTIRGNQLSGFNTSLAVQPPFYNIFNFRTFSAGIQVDGSLGEGRLDVVIRDNYVHDALTTGISVSALDNAYMNVDMRGNVVKRVGQHDSNPNFFPPGRPDPSLPSFIANVGINVVSFGQARMEIRVKNTLIEDHGPVTAGLAMEFDALNLAVGGSGVLVALVDDYTYRSPLGTGAKFSSFPLRANVDAGADGARIDVDVRNSRIGDAIGFPIGFASYFSLKNTSQTYVVRNTVVERSDFGIALQHGAFTALGAPNEGSDLRAEFVDNEIRLDPGGSGDGLHLINFAGEFSNVELLVEGNLFAGGGGGMGRGLLFQDNGATRSSAIDVGGGALGSEGGNSIDGFITDIESLNYVVKAEDNWWGSPAGPASVVEGGSGSIDFMPFLLVNPFP